MISYFTLFYRFGHIIEMFSDFTGKMSDWDGRKETLNVPFLLE